MSDTRLWGRPSDWERQENALLERMRDLRTAVTALDHARVAVLRAMPYEEYLKSRHWKETRDRAVTTAGNRCRLCSWTRDSNEFSPLEVHHATYDRIGCEQYEDLVVLCRPCHERHHGKAQS